MRALTLFFILSVAPLSAELNANVTFIKTDRIEHPETENTSSSITVDHHVDDEDSNKVDAVPSSTSAPFLNSNKDSTHQAESFHLASSSSATESSDELIHGAESISHHTPNSTITDPEEESLHQASGWTGSSTDVDVDKWELAFSERQSVIFKSPKADMHSDNRSIPWRCPLLRKEIDWLRGTTTSASVVQKDGLVYAVFAIKDTLKKTTRIGLAWGIDGVNFHSMHPEPVLYPSTDRWSRYEWEGGCKEPRVVKGPNGLYVMTYTAQSSQPRIMIATSYDLVHWKKHGPAFAKAHQQTFLNAWSSSGAILAEPAKDGTLTAVKINGTYWMYWGEHNVHLATSTDLIAWVPLLSSTTQESYKAHRDHVSNNPNSFATKPISVLRPRRGKFDSDSVDPGPVALLREDGILLVYNAKNLKCSARDLSCHTEYIDKQSAPGSRQLGEALFSRENPRLLLDRSKKPIFAPSSPDDRLYATGLAYLNDRWLLYYRGEPRSDDPSNLVSVSAAAGYSRTGISLELYSEEDEDFMYDQDGDVLENENSIIEDAESEIFELSKQDTNELSDEDVDKLLQERIFWRVKSRLSKLKDRKSDSKVKKRHGELFSESDEEL